MFLYRSCTEGSGKNMEVIMQPLQEVCHIDADANDIYMELARQRRRPQGGWQDDLRKKIDQMKKKEERDNEVK